MTSHGRKVITYENVYTHHRSNLCVACSEDPALTGCSQVHYGLHDGVCDHDPAEARRIAEYAAEQAQIERDMAIGYDE